MATLTLENLPDELYAALKQSAEVNGRSIDREAIAHLERALRSERTDHEELLKQARELRARTPELFVTDEAIRAARAWGRP